jgi:hypothetical protein
MSREEEEAVLRITAHYVAELREGCQPRLSDYLLRYPQYADAIIDFVTYYHAVEVDVPVEAPIASKEVSGASMLPPLSESSRMVMDRAWDRLSQARGVDSNSSMTLQLAAGKRQKSLPQLAGEVGISVDIMEKLAQSMIDAATIPKEVLKRLAQALVEPLDVISGILAVSANKRMVHGVAESVSDYSLGEQSHIQTQSFREAVERSPNLSNEQKDVWRGILDAEGL